MRQIKQPIGCGVWPVPNDQDTLEASDPSEAQANSQARRKIPGGLPYSPAPGVLGRILEKLPISEKPTAFTQDFLATVLGATGGSSRSIIPILKATGLLNQSGAPTDLYSQFQTEGGRGKAAEQALRNGYAEVFKRNQFAHRADEDALLDIIVAVTGLPRNDRIVRAIYSTFEVFQKYAKTANKDTLSPPIVEAKASEAPSPRHDDVNKRSSSNIGLVYNINVVLPETTNVEVYNAIFKSLRSNLLQ
jgi:hypothetical protein